MRRAQRPYRKGLNPTTPSFAAEDERLVGHPAADARAAGIAGPSGLVAPGGSGYPHTVKLGSPAVKGPGFPPRLTPLRRSPPSSKIPAPRSSAAPPRPDRRPAP